MWDDLVVREITNGTWFLMNASIVIVLGRYLLCQFINSPVKLWWRLRDATSTGTQVAVALFVYFIGASIRAGWVWMVLWKQNRGSPITGFFDAFSNWLLLAVSIGVVGTLCCMRIFSRDQWGHGVWIISAVLAVVIPLIIHFAP